MFSTGPYCRGQYMYSTEDAVYSTQQTESYNLQPAIFSNNFHTRNVCKV
jgi:hypothetical protein